MQASDLAVEASLVVSGEYTSESGTRSAAAILESPLHSTAVAAADATLGLGVRHTLQARGLSVPADVSLIGIHRLPGEEYRHPPMTCVELPLRELGRRAAELVADLPWDAQIKETISSSMAIFAGAMVAAPAGGSTDLA